MMKIDELRELSKDELNLKLSEFEELMFRYRFQNSLGQIENPIKMRELRRDIARIKTIMNERRISTNNQDASI